MAAKLPIPAALALLARGKLAHGRNTRHRSHDGFSELPPSTMLAAQPSLALAESFANRAARPHLVRQPPIRVPE
jgi:hypothetical protein